MEKDIQEVAIVANEGGGGGHPTGQENCQQICQTSCKNKLNLSDKLSPSGLSLTDFFSHFVVAITTIILIPALQATAITLCRYAKSLRIVLLPAFFSISSLKKVLCKEMIFRIFHDSLTLLSRSAPWKRGRLQRPHSGVILVLLALFIPIIVAGIRYSQYRFSKRQDILDTPTHSIYYKKCAKEAALAVAKVWDCSKTLGQQKAAVYAAANAVYNSARTYEEKISPLSAAIPGFVGKKSGVTVMDASKKQVPPSSTGDSYVKISVTEDATNLGKITVQTDDDVASAVPAECNLDVVLAVPVNSTAKVDEIKAELKTFVDGFNDPHGRGVYAGIIPYSGKLSLPSGKYNGWTEGFAALSGTPGTLTLYDLFGTKGVAGTALSTKYDDSGSVNGYAIMCRSSLFDATSASTSKYKRMNLNPCTSVTSSVFDDYKCPSNCTTYNANPHPIMELTADLSSVSTKVSELSVPSDSYNTSNFIFAALEWSNNLFQSWTDSPQRAAVAGGDNGSLGSQAQTTSDRKKAIILVVNKPDTFTAGEMTYLGRSDDADEKKEGGLKWEKSTLPSVASWKSVCYGDGKFVTIASNFESGSAFSSMAYSSNGTDWILERDSVCESDIWHVVFYANNKFIICTTTKPLAFFFEDNTDCVSWTDSNIPRSSHLGFSSMRYMFDKFIMVNDTGSGRPLVKWSNDGINWIESTTLTQKAWIYSMLCYGDGKFIALGYHYDSSNRQVGGDLAYSNDGINWTESDTLLLNHTTGSVTYGNGKFVHVGYYSFDKDISSNTGMCSSDGINWTQFTLPSSAYWISVHYMDGKFVAVASGSDKAAYSTDGINWTESTMPSSSYWRSVCYGGGKLVAVSSSKAAVGQFTIATTPVGNTALKFALDDASPSGVTTLTTNACTKLKETYGDNIQLHVIKYCKEGSDGDYAYLDTCATSTGGSSYDCANQAALKNTLDTIAANLKSWAGRTEARNVN